MFGRLLFILSIFLGLTLTSLAQTDPYCHVEVVSGSPAFFNFTTVDELNNGKTLYYNTCIRITYTKEPDKWSLRIIASDDYFNGPDKLDAKVIRVKAESVSLNSPGSQPLSGNAKYGVNCQKEALMLLKSPGGQEIANGWVVHDASSVDNLTFYVYIRFMCVPDNWDQATLTNKKAGYYLQNSNVYVVSSYKN